MYTYFMDVPQAKKIFDKLYSDVDGYKMSIKARKKLGYFYKAHTYGEVTFDDFYKMLLETKPKQGEIFYDLGSGNGKAVFIAALCFDFSKTVGIEILDELYESSMDVLSEYKMMTPTPNERIDFIKADFNKVDFSDSDVIYINSYYFYYEFITPQFLKQLNQLKKGTRIITLVTPIPDLPFFNTTQKGRFQFSWGPEHIFIHEKIK